MKNVGDKLKLSSTGPGISQESASSSQGLSPIEFSRKAYKAVVQGAMNAGMEDTLHRLWVDVIHDAYVSIALLEARIIQLEAQAK
jgi:hypothetical protein